METAVAYPHITTAHEVPARLEKHPRIRVSMLAADYLWRGWSAEEIVRQYPYLTPAEVHAALVYYFDHRDKIEEELAEELGDAERWSAEHPTPAFLVRLKKTVARP